MLYTCEEDSVIFPVLLKTETHLVKIEDQIQLTNVVEIFVQHLDVIQHLLVSMLAHTCGLGWTHLYKVVYCLQVEQIIIRCVNTDAEVEPRVSPVDDLEVPEFHKVRMLGISDCHYGVNLLYQFLLLLVLEVHVPLGQPRLARPVLDHNELNAHSCCVFGISGNI